MPLPKGRISCACAFPVTAISPSCSLRPAVESPRFPAMQDTPQCPASISFAVTHLSMVGNPQRNQQRERRTPSANAGSS